MELMGWLDHDPAMGRAKGINMAIINRDEERWREFFQWDWHDAGTLYVEETADGWRINGLIQCHGQVMKRKGWAEWPTREEAVEAAKSLSHTLQGRYLNVDFFEDPSDSPLCQ